MPARSNRSRNILVICCHGWQTFPGTRKNNVDIKHASYARRERERERKRVYLVSRGFHPSRYREHVSRERRGGKMAREEGGQGEREKA